MNISGLLAKGDSFALDKIQGSLGISLEKKEDRVWSECQSGSRDDNEIIVVFRNSSLLVLCSPDLIMERWDSIYKMLSAVQKGVMFGCSETSMVFLFHWFEFMKQPFEDAYTFDDRFEVSGANKMQLFEDNDIIFDGLFPLIESYIGDLQDNEICNVYTYSDNGLTDSVPSEMELAKKAKELEGAINKANESKLNLINGVKKELNVLLNEIINKRTANGYVVIKKLISLYKVYRTLDASFVSKNKEMKMWPEKKLKSELIFLIREMNDKALHSELVNNLLLPLVVECSGRPNFDLTDIRYKSTQPKRFWEFWK